jgi:hypothetical protein
MNTVRKLLGLRPWMRHSLVLAVAGTVYVLVGISYIVSVPTPSGSARTTA